MTATECDTGPVPDQGLAWGVAVTHLAAIAVTVTGGLLSWRWPRFVRLHIPVAVAIAVVNAVGAKCPLTELELHLRQSVGEHPYTGGFISHYLVEPVHPAGVTPGVRLTIYAIAIIPNVVAYTVLFRRHAIRRRAGLSGR